MRDRQITLIEIRGWRGVAWCCVLAAILWWFFGCDREPRWERWEARMDGEIHRLWVGTKAQVDAECELRGEALPTEKDYGGCNDPVNRVQIVPRDAPQIVWHETCHALVGAGHGPDRCELPRRLE